MSRETSFSIGEHFGDPVEEQKMKLAATRAALIEGEQSGPSTPFNFEAFIERKRAARS